MEPHHFYPFAPLFFVFAIVIVVIALKHRRRMAQIEMLKLYLAQNREPPAEIMRHMHGHHHWHNRTSRWHRAIFFGSLSAGLGLAYLVVAPLGTGPHSHIGMLIWAIVLGCLAIGQILSALLTKPEDTSPPSS